MPNEFDWVINLNVPPDVQAQAKKTFTKKTVSPLPVLVEELFLPYSNALNGSSVRNKFLTFDFFLKKGDKVSGIHLQDVELGKYPAVTLLAVAREQLLKLKTKFLEVEDWDIGCLIMSKKEVRQDGIILATQYVWKLEAKEVPVNVINKESVKKPKKAAPSRLLLDSLEGMNDA